MKIDIPTLLSRYSSTLLSEVAPGMNGGPLAGSVQMIAIGLKYAALQLEDGVDWLVTENRIMRALFADAASWIPDESLAARLGIAALTTDDSFRLSDLNRGHDALTALLIELQTVLERDVSPQARELEHGILLYLKGFADRRHFGPRPESVR